jgi:hypothetical protein
MEGLIDKIIVYSHSVGSDYVTVSFEVFIFVSLGLAILSLLVIMFMSDVNRKQDKTVRYTVNPKQDHLVGKNINEIIVEYYEIFPYNKTLKSYAAVHCCGMFLTCLKNQHYIGLQNQ